MCVSFSGLNALLLDGQSRVVTAVEYLVVAQDAIDNGTELRSTLTGYFWSNSADWLLTTEDYNLCRVQTCQVL